VSEPGPGPAAAVPVAPVARPLFTRPGLLALVWWGGAIGTLLRHAIEQAIPVAPGQWPWATFGINVSGSFVLGALLGGLARSGPDHGWRRTARLGVGTGFCGGFTTYSTFIVEVDTLARGGWAATGAAYALVSVVLGVAAALTGMRLMRRIPMPRRMSRAAA